MWSNDGVIEQRRNSASSEGEGGSCNEVATRVGEMCIMAPDDLVRQVGWGVRHARVLAILMLIESIGATGEASVIVSLHETESMFVTRS